jgi:hypothetical protein
MRVVKSLILDRLVTELQAAGVQVTRLGSYSVGGGEFEVYTYDALGLPVDLPETASPVIDAHDGRTEEEVYPLQYGTSVPSRPQLKAGVDTMQIYIDKPNANITPAETVAVTKLHSRAVLFILRRLGL